MASRLVTATLVLDGVEGVITGFKQAGKAAVEYGKALPSAGARASAWVDKHRAQVDKIGGSLLKVGAAGALAIGGLIKQAVDWESAWAGVTKTVDGTPEQLAAIEQGLRDMTKVLPASHEELAAVAEAAGQLGVRTEDVLGFTRTMVDLGETTNLTSEEAATSLQQMMNVMGTAGSDVDRLGAAVVALGNNGASTEKDIVSLAQRVAAAGSQVGMTEADVLGMASALASVGIEAEAGGTAMSLTLKQIDGFVREGGDGLETLAKVSGKSAAEFSSAWRNDAASAVADLVEGMGAMQSRGEDVNGVLSDLGFNGIRQTDALLRLAGATKAAGTEQNLLREALELGSEAWAENTALADEAAQRYKTRAAQTQMALNSIRDEAITLGQTLLPILDTVIKGVNDVTSAIGDIPKPAQDVGLGILAVGTAGALAAGGVLKLVVAASNLRAGLQALGLTVRGFTLATGAVGVAIAAAGWAFSNWMNQQADARAKTEAYTAAIKEQGEVIGKTTREMAAQTLQDAGVLDLAEQYGANLADVTDAALGSAEAMERVRASIRGNSAELEAKIAMNEREMETLRESGSMTERQAIRYNDLTNANEALNAELSNRVSGTDEVTRAIEAEMVVVAEATDGVAQLEAATAESAATAKDAAAAALEHEQAEQARAEAMAAAEDATRDALEAAQHYGNMLLQLSGSQIGVESAIADLNETLAENTKEYGKNAGGLDLQTEAGRKNQRALDDLAKASMSYVETLDEQNASADEIAAATSRAREQWIAGAVAMGMGEDQAIALANAYFGIPKDVKTSFATPGAKLSQQEADTLNEKLRNIPDSVRSEIVAIAEKEGLAAAEAALARLQRERTVRIRATYVGVTNSPVAGRTIAEADGGVVRYYANGGTEKHVAQIAPAGAWRVWAEPETGGEAYIPLAPEKRSRSLQIWRETGRHLGVRGYADGMVVTTRSAPATTGPVYSPTFNTSGTDPQEVTQLVWDKFQHWTESEATVRR